MRRILLLGMAVLLVIVALPSYGQERETLFSASFTTDLDGFTAIDGDSYYGWYRDSYWKRIVAASTDSESSSYGIDIDKWITSPIIDISGKNNLNLSFNNAFFSPQDWENKRSFLCVMVKVDGGEWFQMGIDQFYYSNNVNSLTFGISNCNLATIHGESLQFAFRVKNNFKYNIRWFIDNCSLTGVEGDNPELPIEISSLVELQSIESGSLVKIQLDSLFCNYTDYDQQYLHDKTGVVILNTPTYEIYRGYYFNCNFVGQLTKGNGLPEITAMKGSATKLIPEDEYYEYYEEYKVIPASEYWNNLGNLVEMTLDHEDFIIEDLLGSHFYNTDQKSFNTKNYKIKVAGIVQPTVDGKERIVFTRSITLDVYLSDEEPITDMIPRTYVYVERPIKGGQWNTLCLPYKLQRWSGTCATFVSADEGVFNFKKTTYDIPAGTPFLYKPSSSQDMAMFGGSGWVQLKPISASSKNGGDYSFVGTLKPVTPKDGSYYLTEGNTIKPLASGGTIKGFRAYFRPNSSASANARAICIDGETTAIEDIVDGEELFGIPQKVYTVNGQYAGDDLEALPKGVYIVNGKKIIK